MSEKKFFEFINRYKDGLYATVREKVGSEQAETLLIAAVTKTAPIYNKLTNQEQYITILLQKVYITIFGSATLPRHI